MSGLLSPAGLAMTRSYLESSLHATCDIYPKVEAAGVQTWPTKSVTVQCMKGNPGRGGDQGVMYDGNAPMARFWVPVSTVVASGDRLLFEGRWFDVVMLPARHADELLRPLDCIEFRAPGEAV